MGHTEQVPIVQTTGFIAKATLAVVIEQVDAAEVVDLNQIEISVGIQIGKGSAVVPSKPFLRQSDVHGGRAMSDHLPRGRPTNRITGPRTTVFLLRGSTTVAPKG